MKKLLIIVPFAAVLIFLVFYFRGPEYRIRKNLTALEGLLTKSPDELPIASLGRAGRVGTFFTEDCSITVGDPVPDIRGNSQLVAIVYRARQSFHRADVNFADISISVTDKNNAELTLTPTATVYEQGSLMGRVEAWEVELTMVKINGSWKIKKVTAIETLH